MRFPESYDSLLYDNSLLSSTHASMYVIHTDMCRAYHDNFNSKLQLNCAHIAQDCPLEKLIQTQLQDKNGVKRILVIVGCRGRIEVKAKVPNF